MFCHHKIHLISPLRLCKILTITPSSHWQLTGSRFSIVPSPPLYSVGDFPPPPHNLPPLPPYPGISNDWFHFKILLTSTLFCKFEDEFSSFAFIITDISNSFDLHCSIITIYNSLKFQLHLRLLKDALLHSLE